MKNLFLTIVVIFVFGTASSYAWQQEARCYPNYYGAHGGWTVDARGPGGNPYYIMDRSFDLLPTSSYSRLIVNIDSCGPNGWTGYSIGGGWPSMRQGRYYSGDMNIANPGTKIRLRVHSDTYDVAQALFYYQY
jgi:hypothetical protein